MPIQKFPLLREKFPEHFLYDFEGLKIKTDRWDKQESDRVLGLGGAAWMLMNYMYHHPELVKDKEFLEPFAGSGPYGLLALKLGAAHSDLLDINPRAIQFINDNLQRNRLDQNKCSIIEGDIREFHPSRKYDVLFANPPFVPVPTGIGMAIHSDGGSDGNVFLDILLSKFPLILKPQGQAFLKVFQIEDAQGPTVLHYIRKHIPERWVELTKIESESLPFEELAQIYTTNVPDKTSSILEWSKSLKNQFGEDLTYNHYMIHIGSVLENPVQPILRVYDESKYGRGFNDPEDNLVGAEIRLFVEG